MDTPRKIAVDLLKSIEKGAFAEPLLDEALSDGRIPKLKDRRLLTQIVYGTLRMQGRLDWIIAQLYKGNAVELEADVRNILRIGLFQLIFTERIPGYAVCNEAVSIAKESSPKAAGLVNAVLRNAIRRRNTISYPDEKEDPALFISAYHSHPLWLVEKWMAEYGIEETKAICQANNEIPPAVVRANRLKAAREEVMPKMHREGFDVSPTNYSPDGVVINHAPVVLRDAEIFKAGLVQMQDEASQLIAYLVAPRPGEGILDLCAGTGGKTTHLAELMRNEGSITAVDIRNDKLSALQINAKRLGITIIATMAGDARSPAMDGKFDRILIDAPCSGLGSLRRNPEIKWRLKQEDILRFAQLQREILDSSVRFLKTSGRLVYSTCTNLHDENEEVVKAVAGEHGLQLLTPALAHQFISEGFFKTKTFRDGTDSFFGAVMSFRTSGTHNLSR